MTIRSNRRQALAACIAAAFAAALPSDARPPADASTATIRVDTCADDGVGSLRAALAGANGGDVIDLTRLACSVISLTTGALELSGQGVAIVGPGRDRLAIDAGGHSRVLFAGDTAAEVVVRGVSIRNGRADGDGGCVESAGSLTLNDVLVQGCEASGEAETSGGGVHARGTLVLDHARIIGNQVHSATHDAFGGGAASGAGALVVFSTLDGNTATSGGEPTYHGTGGGLSTGASALVASSTISGNHAGFAGGLALYGATPTDASTVEYSTISGNVASDRVGGLNAHANVRLHNTTIAFNCAMRTQFGKYVAGIGVNGPTGGSMTFDNAIVSGNVLCDGAAAGTAYDVGGLGAGAPNGSHNIVRAVPSAFPLPPDTRHDDPLLGPLADNGGPTKTHALAAGSPAIDAGNPDLAPAFDQRSDGYWIDRSMSDPHGAGERDPRSAGWSAGTAGMQPDIGAFELQQAGATHAVTQCGDDGDGSLRAMVALAHSGDRIDLTGLLCDAIALKTAIEVEVGNLAIDGPGAERLEIRPDDPLGKPHRLITHTGAGSLELRGLAFAHGEDRTTGEQSAQGGCIASRSRVRGEDLVFRDCRASATDGRCDGGAVRAGAVDFERVSIEHAACTTIHGAGEGGAVSAPLLSLLDVHVTDASASGAATRGGDALRANEGGIGGCIASTARARIERSTLDHCTAAFSAAGAFASFDLVDSTVSDNQAQVRGGGLYAEDAVLANSTVASNTHLGADNGADGLLTATWARIDSSILAGNGGAGGIDLDGGPIVGAHALVGRAAIAVPSDTLQADPRLGPLQDNGGTTPTRAPIAGSPAIDAGSNPLALAHDQRGVGHPRIVGAAADIGAFETGEGEAIFHDGFDG